MSRIYLLDFPAGNDESLYYLLGNETLKGNIPYSTFYEMKPPFLFYNYAYIVFLFGYSVKGLHLGALWISMLNAVLMYAFVHKYFSAKKAVQASVLFWILISSPFLNGMYLVAEHFVLLYTLGAMYFVVSHDDKEKVRLFIAGLLIGIAVLTKQTAVFFIPAITYLLWRNKEGISFIQKMIWTGAGGLSLLLCNLMVLYFLGSLDEAYYWIISHGKAYTSKVGFGEGMTNLKHVLSLFIKNYWIPLLLVLGGLASMYLNKKTDYLLFVLLLVGGSLIALFPGLRFYSQYWILLLPGITLSGVWVTELKPGLKNTGLIFSFLLLASVLSQYKSYFPKNKELYADNLFGGQYFSKTALLSAKLDRIITKDENLLVLGGLPQTYLYTEKEPFTRHVWTSMINYKSKKCEEFRKELIADFEKTKPEYVLFSYNPYHWTMTKNHTDEIYNYMYRQVRMNYDKIMAVDLDNSHFYYQEQVGNLQEKANSIFVYKRRP